MTKRKGAAVQQPDLLGMKDVTPIKGEIKVGDTVTGIKPGQKAKIVAQGSAKPKPQSKAIAVAQPQQQVALKPSGDPMVDMYERALRDPAVDPSKLKALLDIRAEEVAREAHRHFNIALHDAQAKIPRIFANKSNKSTSSRYADYPSLDTAIRPIYVECGFGLTFNTGKSAIADHVLVYCDVVNAGHEKRYEIDMPADGKGAKGGDVMTKTHATGSAVSYGMRYLLIMIFNIPIIKDDDGNRAGKVHDAGSTATYNKAAAVTSDGFPGDPITAKQRDEIIVLITDAKITEKNFCVRYGIEQIGFLPAELFEAAKKAIAEHKATKAGK
jgi:hypothetical protein